MDVGTKQFTIPFFCALIKLGKWIVSEWRDKINAQTVEWMDDFSYNVRQSEVKINAVAFIVWIEFQVYRIFGGANEWANLLVVW